MEEIDAATLETCRKNGHEDCYIRPIAWRGSEQIGVTAQDSKIHLAIAAWEWPSYFDPEQKKKGIRLTYAKYRRPDPRSAPVHAKATGLYMICTISKHLAERAGYADALMLDYRGYIAEATGANIFFIRDGVIHTPTPDCFLNGITRQTVIRIAKSRGFEVVERHILPEELATFSECFVVGSAAEIVPVGSAGPWNFEVGDLTRQIQKDYSELVRGKLTL